MRFQMPAPAAVPVENSANLKIPRRNQENTANLTWTSSPEEQLELQQGESFQDILGEDPRHK